MPNRPFAFLTVAAAALMAACGGAGSPASDTPTPLAADEWRFGVEPHIALWYHGLTLARVGVDDAAPVPIYRSGYAEEAQAARRRLAGGSSPFAQDPTAPGARIVAAGVADRMQFLPLYFESWTQMLQAVDVWRQASGDPNRVSGEAAAVVAFLSSRFPNASQRAAVVEWVGALESERTAFFDAWWREVQPSALATEADALWRRLQPDLTAFLRYNDASNGRVSLTPALTGEGRLEMGRGIAVAAVGGRAGDDAREIVGRIIHELSYSLAAEAIRDAVAPARIREIGEDVLVARAAVRAGAMVLERVAPDLVGTYTADYLRAAGADPASSTLIQRFPLPDELVEPLESAVRLATAGI